VEHDRRQRDRAALDRREEQRPVRRHEHAGGERRVPVAGRQAQLGEPSGRRAPRGQRERAEQAAAPGGDERMLGGLLHEDTQRAQQHAAGDHRHPARAAARRGTIGNGAGGRRHGVHCRAR
jgi:hypothetical protein